MKKILIIAALLGGSYFAYSKFQSSNSEPEESNTLENKIVIFPNGNWVYVKNGQGYFVSAEAWSSYQKQFPGVPAINIDQATADKINVVGGVSDQLQLNKF